MSIIIVLLLSIYNSNGALAMEVQRLLLTFSRHSWPRALGSNLTARWVPSGRSTIHHMVDILTPFCFWFRIEDKSKSDWLFSISLSVFSGLLFCFLRFRVTKTPNSIQFQVR